MTVTGVVKQGPPMQWAVRQKPSEWRLCRLKDVVDINARSLPETTDPDFWFRYVDIGSVDADGRMLDGEQMSFGAAPSRARRLVRQGDSIVSTVRTYLKAIAYVDEAAASVVVSTGFATLTPRAGLDQRYLYWWLRSSSFVEEIVARSVGVSYPAVNASDLADVAILLPPLEDQRRIARLLDDRTGQIDRLVDEQLTLAASLRDRFRRLSSLRTAAALVPDLNGREPPTPPRGWITLPVRRCLASADYGIGEAAKETGEIAVLGMVNVNDEGEIEGPPGGFVESVERHLLLRPGDLLFNRTNSLAKVGKVGLVRVVAAPTTAASYLVILRSNGLAVPDYLNYLLNTDEVLGVARSMALPSVNQANLNPTRYGKLKIPLPPQSDQLAVVSELNNARSWTETSIDEIKAQCSLLREHRQALISTAVTAGLDAVRKVA